MFKAFVLVRNLESNGEILDFGKFTIKRVGPRFSDLRAVFSSLDVNQDDWILEKSYNELPPGTLGYPVGGIPNDIEDILLLLRLYRSGDISFIKLAIVPPSGEALVQFPNRAVNDLNSYSDRHFKVESAECESWKAFADDIREGPPWKSHWFATARRFFLSGGAKPFNPSGDDVDRVVDYATALESTLVPENDFNTRRISRRAAALTCTRQSRGSRCRRPANQDGCTKFVRVWYTGMDWTTKTASGYLGIATKLSAECDRYSLQRSGNFRLETRTEESR